MSHKGLICDIFREHDQRKGHVVTWMRIWSFRALSSLLPGFVPLDDLVITYFILFYF